MLLSLLALVALLLLFIVIACILRLTGEGEIFFRQRRVGVNGAYFNILKFVTMLKNSPNMGVWYDYPRQRPESIASWSGSSANQNQRIAAAMGMCLSAI